jgi:membrane protein implicated in regulation of membrane protease activity
MGAAIAALLVGAAAFADQRFPGALPPELDFSVTVQIATFAGLTLVFAVAMRLGRRRAAAMIAKASESPAAPAQPAAAAATAPVTAPPATAPATPMPQPVAPMFASLAPTLAPDQRSPQPPATSVAAQPARPLARPVARPAGNQPMRVTGPTAVTQQPSPPPTPRPARPAAPQPAPPSPEAQALVGKEYTLWKPIAGGKGVLRIAGVDWALKGADVPAGTRVRVVGAEGQTLKVEATS